jgi:hypothetical protein
VGPTHYPHRSTMIWSSFATHLPFPCSVRSPPPLLNPYAPLPFKIPPRNLLNPEVEGSHHHLLPWRTIAVSLRRRRAAAGRWRARRGSGAGRRRGRRACSPCTAARGPAPRSRCSASTPRSAPPTPTPLCGNGPPCSSSFAFFCFLLFVWLAMNLTWDPLCVRGALQARSMLGEGPADTPRGIAVHPAGDELVCATAN